MQGTISATRPLNAFAGHCGSASSGRASMTMSHASSRSACSHRSGLPSLPTATTGTSRPAFDFTPLRLRNSRAVRATSRKQPGGMNVGGCGSHQLS